MHEAARVRHDHELVLGRFRPLRPLGSGGSGSVWLARDEEEGCEVALKIVPREGRAGPRAEREALAVARLKNRYCARARAVLRDDGHVYVAYEYIPGRTLREALRAGELSDAETVEAAAQILEALAHAHRRRIVHRDVKPANVLVTDADTVSIRLLDFGLAQIEDADTLTAAGDVPGTLAYISPERLAGREATGAADVWSVGVILWEALAGYQPFWASSPVETAQLIAKGAPRLAKLRPDLPRSLTRAVDRALALDPGQRPAAARLAAELRSSLEEAAERRSRQPTSSRKTVADRLPHAVLATAFAAAGSGLLPFYPDGAVPILATIVFLAALTAPRIGLALALAVPLLPLGNVSQGLAVVYAAAAVLWLLAFWGDARSSLLAAGGPLLALGGALLLVPALVQQGGGAARRAWQAGAAVLLAAVVAGLRRAPLPWSGETPPLGLGIEGSDSPTAVAGALGGALVDHPLIGISAIVLAVAALALPVASRAGFAGAAAFLTILGAVAFLLPPLVGAGHAQALAVLPGLACLAAWLALDSRRARGGNAS